MYEKSLDIQGIWWQRGIIYQVYPRSFMDSNGDGIGDLPGLIGKLDYLAWLGIDALWLSPIFPSPMADFGYDISDYTDIHPLFGTLADFDRLLAEAQGRHLKVILDYVPNHTSDQHPWFVASRSSRRHSKRAWYIWCDPAPDGGPPNNWRSVFGGSAWEWDATTGQYYYHAYLKAQPDLNWRNPEVQTAMLDVLRFWLDRGVDGFRVDALRQLIKDDQRRDNPPNPAYHLGQGPYDGLLPVYTTDRPEVQTMIALMRSIVDMHEERLLIGELYLPIDRLVTYYGVRASGVHLPFNFHLIRVPWRARAIESLIETYEAALPPGAWPNWVLGNHDQHRLASRIGMAQARVAAMLLLTLRGTPTLYYGDELGMADVTIPPELAQDPWEKNVPGLGLGRDPERTPMQWDDSPNAGFTVGSPWLPIATDYQTINVVRARQDPLSILTLYRRLIALRRATSALSVGSYVGLQAHSDVLAYVRAHAGLRCLVVLNLGTQPQAFESHQVDIQGHVVLSTHLDRTDETVRKTIKLRSDEGLIVRLERPISGHQPGTRTHRLVGSHGAGGGHQQELGGGRRMLKLCGIGCSTITVVLFMTMIPSGMAAQGIPNYRAVTDQRLSNPSTPNWLLYRATYDGWGFHPADLINSTNVKQLVPLWRFATGEDGAHQAPPIVNAGVMFITTPHNQVVALNAFTGEVLWRYTRQLPVDIFQPDPTNRGVALYEEKVYLATLDAHLVALDAKTGQVIWEKAVDDYKKGYYMTLAPLVANGKVLVGMAGGEYGLRGCIAAFDARTGDGFWKRYTIPGPGEPGHETWTGESWRTGGASPWSTGHYDPFLKLAYWGTGSVSPWPADAHPGDNLHAASVIALDVDTGRVKNRFQYHWNDSWGWDEVSAPLMIRLQWHGRVMDALVHAGRNGYLWVLERSSDAIRFVDAKPYVAQNVFTSIDSQTGRPVYHPERKLTDGKTVTFCPSVWGGKHWPPAAYNPHTGYLYIPANENLCSTLTGKLTPHVPGRLFLGIDEAAARLAVRDGATHIGELQAWDLKTMQKAWTQTFRSANWGAVLATAGDLVFMGGTHDRYFRAFDAKTGEVLWEFQTNSAVTGVPISYGKIGRQYIAVLSGWGGESRQMQMQVDAAMGTKTDVPRGGVLWVFGLPE